MYLAAQVLLGFGADIERPIDLTSLNGGGSIRLVDTGYRPETDLIDKISTSSEFAAALLRIVHREIRHGQKTDIEVQCRAIDSAGLLIVQGYSKCL